MSKGIGAELVKEARKAGAGLRERVEDGAARQKERLRSVAKTRKSAKTRKRIMDCASQIMAERGNTAFMMSEISHRCDMSKGAMYYYFSDKDDLLKAVYAEEVNRLVQAIDDAMENAETAHDALHGVCGAYAESMGKGGALTMALMRELVLVRENTTVVTERPIHHIVGVVSDQLERAKAEGLVRPQVDSRLIAIAVCGAFAFTAMSMADDATAHKTDADYAEELFQMIMRGIGA